MTINEIMQTLEQMGTSQNVKVYRKHGIKDPLYGVSYANLNALQKKIKVDHELACGLWTSGVHDARILAVMIADPQQMNEELISEWSLGLNDQNVTDYFAKLVVRTSDAHEYMKRWINSDDEWLGRTGWTLLALLAMQDKTLPDSFFEPYLLLIEKGIHKSKNRTREGMNNALIAIGMRSDTLEELAVASAGRIGRVEIDHGDTSCKTPEAVSYIRKGRTRLREKV